MPTFENPAADADEVQAVLRALAHATRSIDDPRDIYSVLGSLTAALGSLSQSLHQLARFHDGANSSAKWATEDTPTARSAAYRVSWDLHRAGEMVRQVGEVVENAHEAEAILRYHPEFPTPPASHAAPSHGLPL
ncbi:MAG: hypothetical protein ACJ716_01595 [Marmoricola sp.]